MCPRKLSQRAVHFSAGLLIALGLAATARAQHTPDPYNIVGEGNLGYQDFMYSNYPNGIGFSPNQGIFQSRSANSRANTFSNYVDELDGVSSGDSTYGRGRGGIQPYYRAHHQYDEAFNRIYSPNAAPDKTYQEDQQVRTDKYLAYLRESDPRKRAQLYKEYNQSSLRAARDFGLNSPRSAARPGAAARTAAPPVARSPSGLPETSSTLPAARPSSAVGGRYRQPSTAPPAASRPRGTATATPPAASALSETPEQILNRAERMERANRATARPTTPSRTPAPAR